jgi:hypothetical protein
VHPANGPRFSAAMAANLLHCGHPAVRCGADAGSDNGVSLCSRAGIARDVGQTRAPIQIVYLTRQQTSSAGFHLNASTGALRHNGEH